MNTDKSTQDISKADILRNLFNMLFGLLFARDSSTESEFAKEIPTLREKNVQKYIWLQLQIRIITDRQSAAARIQLVEREFLGTFDYSRRALEHVSI